MKELVYNIIFDQLKNMKVTNKLISDLAELAKLRFNKSENEKMKSDFKNMLDFIDKLSEVNTKILNH